MSAIDPQFRAKLRFKFREGGSNHPEKFIFPENGLRQIPILMEGVVGLHTMSMRIDGFAEFYEGDEVQVDCTVIWPEAFYKAAVPGTKFGLWSSGGFYADGEVLERFEDGWPTELRETS